MAKAKRKTIKKKKVSFSERYCWHYHLANTGARVCRRKGWMRRFATQSRPWRKIMIWTRSTVFTSNLSAWPFSLHNSFFSIWTLKFGEIYTERGMGSDISKFEWKSGYNWCTNFCISALTETFFIDILLQSVFWKFDVLGLKSAPGSMCRVICFTSLIFILKL